MDAHANFAIASITSAPSPAASGTSLDVSDPSVFPAVPFNATVWPTGFEPTSVNAEIVRVTNISGSTFTIQRTQEGTSARTIGVGDLIANTLTVKVLTDIEAALTTESGDRVSADDILSNAISAVSSGLSNEASARSAKDDFLSNAISVVSQAVSIVSVAVSVVSAAQAATSAELASVKDRVSGISAAVSTLSADHTSLKDRLSALSDSHTSLVNRVSANSATGGSGSVTSAEHLSVVDRVSAVSSLVSTTASALSVRIDTVSNAVSALSTQLSLQMSAISQAHSVLSARFASVMSSLDGGTTGQVLKKQSNADFDYAWDTDATGGSTSGTVTSATLVSITDRISIVSSLVSTTASALSVRVDTVSDAVSVETAARIVADDALSTLISALSQQLSLQISAISQAHSALSAAHVSLVDRTSANSALISTTASALSVRIDTVSNAVSVLSVQLSLQMSAISQAHSALSAAHVSLVDRVSANSAAATVSVTSAELSAVSLAAQSALSTETSARIAADSALSTLISTLSAQLSLQISAISQAHSVLSAAHVSLVDRVSANSGLMSTTASALSVRIDTVSNAVSVLSVQLSLQISALSQAHSVLSAAHVSLVDRVSANSAAGTASVTSAEYLSLVNRVSANSAAVAGTGGPLSATNGWSVAVSAGAPIYWTSVSANTFRLASAGNTPGGLVLDGSIASGAVGVVQTRDIITLTTGQWDAITGQSGGLTIGSLYYIGTTPGTLTVTLPTAAARAIGVALSTTDMQLRISEVGDWLSDAISVGTATAAALSNRISALLAGFGTSIQMRAVQTDNSINGSALSNLSGLSISVEAGGVYQLDARMLFRRSAVSAIGFGLSYPALANGAFRWEANHSAAVASGLSTTGYVRGYVMESAAAANTNAIHISIPNTGPSAGFTYYATLEGMLKASANGTVQVVFKQAVSVSGTMILQGSFLRAYRII